VLPRHELEEVDMSRKIPSWIGTIVMLAAISLPAVGQRTTGTLRGQVLDPQGATVGDASVTVLNGSTGVEQVPQRVQRDLQLSEYLAGFIHSHRGSEEL